MLKASLAILLLIGCSSPAPTELSKEVQLELVVPTRYAHWRGAFQEQWLALQQSQQKALTRWKKSSQGEFKVILFESPLVAQQYYLANGLSGRVDTPRTFTAQRLALLVLPADDRLLAELPSPPQTILHDFRHEASHLISCDYPELLAAPKWFQEGWAEMWAPLNSGDVSVWPHAHDLHRWFEQLDWNNLTSAPAEVRYSFMAHAAALCLQNSADSQPWMSQPDIDLPPPPAIHGLRGRHAFWDTAKKHYLLSSMMSSQVDLDLPDTWDGRHDLMLKMRVGATTSPLAGVVFYTHGEDIVEAQLLRIPIDVNGGINAYVDSAKQMLIRSLYPLPQKQKFGAWREVRLHHANGSIVVSSGDLERIISLTENSLQFPLAIRMYSRNGSFELKHEKILN